MLNNKIPSYSLFVLILLFKNLFFSNGYATDYNEQNSQYKNNVNCNYAYKNLRIYSRYVNTNNQSIQMYDGLNYELNNDSSCLALKEVGQFQETNYETPKLLAKAAILEPLSKTNYSSFYNKYSYLINTPDSSSISDVDFGFQRQSYRGFNLEKVYKQEDLELVKKIEENLETHKLCTKTNISNSSQSKYSNSYIEYFVSDFSMLDNMHFNSSSFESYTPALKSFYCFSSKSDSLLPVGIWIKDSNIVYTPNDKSVEWRLAKIAVNTAENCYMQVDHLLSTHAYLLPIRTNAHINMNPSHPLNVLIQYHTSTEINTDIVVLNTLFVEGGIFDNNFGFGVHGAVKLAQYFIANNTLQDRYFMNDINKRNISSIKNHLYYKTGNLYYSSLYTFINSYVDYYYTTDYEIDYDTELQNFLKSCSKVLQLKTSNWIMKTKDDIKVFLTEVIFISTFRHHAMNSKNTWNTISLPNSPLKMIKRMPQKKLLNGEKIKLEDYIIDTEDFPSFIYLVASFYRPVLSKYSLNNIYTGMFDNISVLSDARNKLVYELNEMENYMIKNYNKHKNFNRLLPSLIPINAEA